ncbi:MAG: putative DNA binding domain-containing protein [Bacteroidales bacterium]|nr:putative DNA binding domain-containing protein [Bacteroidales bacterium]
MEESTTYDKKSLKTVQGKTSDFSELAKDCVAFANAKGGSLHIGIEDDNEFPPENQIIDPLLPEKIVKRINELTINVGLFAQIITAENGGQYIDLKIFPANMAIAGTTKGQFYYRDSDKTRPLMPDELSRLMTDKPAYNWETTVSAKINLEKADNTKLKNFVKQIRNSDRVSAFVKDKNDEELLAYYQMIDDNRLLTNLGILWIGTQEQRARLLYSPIIQYIKYDTDDNKVLKYTWDDYQLNPQELMEDIWQKIPDWKESNEISDGLWRKNIPAYNEKVVRELLCNAIVHRPYTTRGDIFIKLYPDRMEITNPGPLPMGVTSQNILQKTVKRNIHLAKVFYDLHLMEAEGSGYDLMYELQLSVGKQVPLVKEGDDYVEITVFRKIIDTEILKLIEYVNQNYSLTQKNRIVLGIIAVKQKILSTELTSILQLQDGERMRSYVDNLINQGLVITRGQKKGNTFLLNPKLLDNAKFNRTTTLKTIEPHRLSTLIEEDLRIHPLSKISDIADRLPDADLKDIRKMVYNMVSNGMLIPNGANKNKTYELAKKK